MSDKATVSDIFRRALEMRKANPAQAYTDVKAQIVSEYSGKAFPDTAFLTIPEYDNITPEEDWTAGLPIVEDNPYGDLWFEQVENYPKESLREDDPVKEWRNRDRRIAAAEEKNFNKWMPEELMAMAKNNVGGK